MVEGKAPDIRLQARNTDASLPIEIKVAESWTLKELDDALTIQLGGRYLRAQDAHHGVLLVVHQKARPHGWRNAKGRMLTFPQVIKHLQKIADATAAVAPDAPQARIAVLDVSDIGTTARERRPNPKPARGAKRKPNKVPKAKSRHGKINKSKKPAKPKKPK